jgi:hypothetical protein
VRAQERRESFVEIGIHQPVDPPLTDAHQGCEGDGGVVKRQRQWRAMKIPAAQNLAAAEDQGIVGGGSALHFHGLARVT